MRYKINWRFVLVLSAITAVCLVAVHFTHRWQIKRQVGVFLREADAARDAGDTNRERGYLQRYLMARPTENDIRERLGRLVCKNARSGRDLLQGYLIIDDTLHREPQQRRTAPLFDRPGAGPAPAAGGTGA